MAAKRRTSARVQNPAEIVLGPEPEKDSTEESGEPSGIPIPIWNGWRFWHLRELVPAVETWLDKLERIQGVTPLASEVDELQATFFRLSGVAQLAGWLPLYCSVSRADLWHEPQEWEVAERIWARPEPVPRWWCGPLLSDDGLPENCSRLYRSLRGIAEHLDARGVTPDVQFIRDARASLANLREYIAEPPVEQPVTSEPAKTEEISSVPSPESSVEPLFHTAADDPPEEYDPNGPLSGLQSALSKAVSPHAKDHRAGLHTKLQDGTLWGREVTRGKHYEIWFKSEHLYRAARKRLESASDSR